jgi:hypothetical protein
MCLLPHNSLSGFFLVFALSLLFLFHHPHTIISAGSGFSAVGWFGIHAALDCDHSSAELVFNSKPLAEPES